MGQRQPRRAQEGAGRPAGQGEQHGAAHCGEGRRRSLTRSSGARREARALTGGGSQTLGPAAASAAAPGEKAGQAETEGGRGACGAAGVPGPATRVCGGWRAAVQRGRARPSGWKLGEAERAGEARWLRKGREAHRSLVAPCRGEAGRWRHCGAGGAERARQAEESEGEQTGGQSAVDEGWSGEELRRGEWIRRSGGSDDFGVVSAEFFIF